MRQQSDQAKTARTGIITLCMVLICFFIPEGSRAEDWTLVKNDPANDIRVYYRTQSSGNIEFRGITHIKSSLGSFVALFEDSETMPEWVYRIEHVTRLKRVDDAQVYVHTIHSMPWPLKPRDAVIHSTLKQDLKTGAVTIHGKALPDYMPRQTKYERIISIESFWEFSPYPDGVVEVVFQGYGEPGGDILSSIYRSPVFSWLVKLFLWQLPFKTLENMKEIIKRPEYQNKTFSYILEHSKK